jgi:hypothetical protein
LPSIIVPMDIDGTSQPGYTNAPLIDLDGVSAGSNMNGLVLDTGSTIRALVINNFTADGILITTDDNTIQSSYIGANAAGTAAGSQPMADGIVVFGVANTIGGAAAAANVISGNTGAGIELSGADAAGNVVEGNLIGTDSTGMVAVGNTVGVLVDSGAVVNTVGGTSSGAGNVISGNTSAGVLIEGNLIGTNAAGTTALANATGVEVLSSATDNIIGGETAASANVISGNIHYGIQADGSTTTGNILANNWVGTGAGGNGSVPNGSGALEITNSAAVLALGGFTGDVVNQGTLGIWGELGLIAITGNYTQNSAGSRDVDLSGTTPAQYGQLQVSGTATLDGTLDVALILAASRSARSRNSRSFPTAPFPGRSRPTCIRAASRFTRVTARRACTFIQPRLRWSPTPPTPGQAPCARRSRTPTAKRTIPPGSSSISRRAILASAAVSGRFRRPRPCLGSRRKSFSTARRSRDTAASRSSMWTARAPA